MRVWLQRARASSTDGQVVSELETTFANNASAWVQCFGPLDADIQCFDFGMSLREYTPWKSSL